MERMIVSLQPCEMCKQLVTVIYVKNGYRVCNWCHFANTPDTPKGQEKKND